MLMSARYYSIVHAYESIFEIHLQFVMILLAHNFSMVTREIDSLWKTFNFFTRTVRPIMHFASLSSLKSGLISSCILAHCL